MSGNDRDRILINLSEGAVAAQAMALSSHLIVQQLLVRWVVKEPNPVESARKMFESLMAHMDDTNQFHFADREPKVIFAARGMIEDVFSVLNQALQKRTDLKKRRPRRK